MDSTLLNKFAIFSKLAKQQRQKLFDASQLKTLASQSLVFKEGEPTDHAIYMIAGEVIAVESDGHELKQFIAGTEDCRFAIGNLSPRPFTLIVKSKTATILMVDLKLQEHILSFSHLTHQSKQKMDEADCEIATEVDPQWLFNFMQSSVFADLPTEKLESFFRVLEQKNYSAREQIITQGQPGDFYYMIKSGSAEVIREEGGVRFQIAQLGPGDAFGEEALLNPQNIRNAHVVMTEAGSLIRVQRQDFQDLLLPPLISEITRQELNQLMRSDSISLIDIRLPVEYARSHLKSSQNIPLYQLRDNLNHLDKHQKLICYCQNGIQSRTAAFILNEKGFKALVLKGGLSAI